MGRYANSSVRLDFPDLSEPDDDIYVVIRNPKTLPLERLTPTVDVELGEDGRPVDTAAATEGTYSVLAGIITDWHVYDATDDTGESAALPLPATVDLIRKLPFDIVNQISTEVAKVFATPQ